MMRKIFAMLLMASMLICVISCGTATVDNAAHPSVVTPLTVYLDSRCFFTQDEINHQKLATVEYQMLTLSQEHAEQHPQLTRVLEELNSDTESYEKGHFEELKEAAEAYVAEMGDDYFYGFTSTSRYVPQRTDSTILSIRVDWSEYSGGVHSNYGRGCYNYDSATGRKLVITDVITDISVLPEIISSKINAERTDNPLDYLEETLVGYQPDQLTWTLNDQGLTVYFSPYEIASFADGVLTATIEFEEYPLLFNEKYMYK